MRRPAHRALRNRRGIALPMAILVMTVLTVGLAAGFAATNSEIATNSAQRAQNRAYAFAQAGLEQFLARRSELGWCSNCVSDPSAAAVDSEYTTIGFTQGSARVIAVKVRPYIDETNPAIYFIRSKGTDSAVKLSGNNSDVYAERAVGVYATWRTATINVSAAWVSLSGLNKAGTGTIDGTDQCGQKSAVAGVTVPKGDLHVSGETFTPGGNPPVDTSKTFTQLRDATTIDWASIVAGSITADFTEPGTGFPDEAWFDANPDSWPIIRVYTNGFSLPNRGRGTIIADSNFTISGSNMWDGIVLVGGKLTSNGNNTTAGATLSGLNFLIGGNPGQSTVDDSDANGQKTYVYDSCNVEKATSGLRSYVAMPNTWMDNVPVW